MAELAGDLLIIVPSRRRPKNIARLLDSVHGTAKLRTHVHVAVDEDDPDLDDYHRVMNHAGGLDDVLETGSRDGLCGWTNKIASRRAAQYKYLASFGDDHVPRTPGWDKALARAIENMGGTGFSYPYDGTREDIPEAVIISSDVVRALGWMSLPGLHHFYHDNVWADLGRGAGCLRHCRAIAVDHVHPSTGKISADKTYAESGEKLAADKETYYEWRRTRTADDIQKVIALREKVLETASV